MHIQPYRRLQSGFTLIEVMIVVLVVAILAAIALPAYNEQIRKSRRATAQAAMLEMSQCMERFNTANGTYVGGGARCQQAATDRYTYVINVASRVAFTIASEPQGGQVSDSCGALGLNQAGTRTHSSGTNCWQ
ncbi:type IV pilin protein [Aquimonas sp.]|jgi:type IV pilus assembly protein PilE|uniref:type IV pilin protein n=1 Tax=Aquimonas sp. TaxID=1872588 RepID=UPI0037C00535